MTRIPKAKGRSADEWIGRSPDATIPDRVKLRVFERYGGKCYRTGKRLSPGEWDCDHIIPLEDGGEHRESNIAPIWRKEHRKKTAEENSRRAVVKRKASKHLLPKPKTKWPKRGFGNKGFDNTKHLDRI